MKEMYVEGLFRIAYKMIAYGPDSYSLIDHSFAGFWIYPGGIYPDSGYLAKK